MDPSELLLQFCAVTGAEPDIASQYMDMADHNLDLAVTLYMENDGGHQQASTTSRARSDSPPPMAPTEAELEESEHLARQMAADNESSAARRQFNFSYTEPMIDEPFEPVMQGVFNQQSRPWDAAEDNNESALARLFRPPYALMTRIDLTTARQQARDSGKLILFNLQDLAIFPCQMLNRDLWSDEVVQDYVREHFIFLQYTVEEAEGQRYKVNYRVDTMPHIAIIDPRTGASKHVWSTSLQPDDFIEQAEAVLNGTSKPYVAAQQDLLALSDEEQLALALAVSRSDMGASAEGSEESMETASEEQTAELAEPAAEAVYTEPLYPEPSPDPASTTRIQFRFPDGKRAMRRFKKADCVAQLYAYVRETFPDYNVATLELRMYMTLLDAAMLPTTLEAAGALNASINVGI